MAETSLTGQLAQHLVRPVLKSNRDRARLHLLDWLACVAGARRTDVAQVVGKSEPDVLIRAAFLANVLEMDDVHRAAILHPGPAVWPAGLAAARDQEAAMEALLDAGVRGYEATIAVGATFDAHHYAHWHNSSTAGGFGAAAAAASVYGLSFEQLLWALGNAGSLAAGLWQMRHEPVMTKQLHIANAARTGIWLARLAQAGLTGPSAILEGPQGLYAAAVPAPNPLRLGQRWRIDEVSFKPWAACRHAHPAIDAALELKQKGRLQLSVEVETYRDAVLFCDRPEPRSVTDAKFSIQHAMAVVAVRGEPRPQDFEPEAIGDPDIAAARKQVSVLASDEFTRRYPEHFGARVRSGGELVERIDTLGDPERPLSRQGIVAKARQLIAWGGLPEREADRAIRQALKSEGGVAPLLTMLEDWL